MRMVISVRLIITATFIFVLFLPVTTLGAGKFNLKPKLSTSWQVDSNYFKAENNEREVHTYLVQPGIEFGYQTAKSRILLDYTLDAHWYDEQDTVPAGQLSAEENDFTGHTGTLRAQTQPFDRLTLGVDNSFQKTRDPASADTFSNSVATDKYYINRLTPSIFYAFEGRFSVGLRYTNTKTDYDLSTEEDTEEHRGMLDLIYNFSETASLDLQYQRWEFDYDLTTSDYTSNRVMLILKKQFKYFSFEVGGGYQDRDFDDATLASLSSSSYQAAVLWQNSPENPRSTISLTSELAYNDTGTGDSYFKAHKVALQAGHLILEKIKVDVNGSYQNSDYERTTGLTPSGATELRDDDTYSISSNIGYLITDWMTFSVGGGYEERDSNLAGKNYTNKYLMVSLDFGYELGGR